MTLVRGAPATLCPLVDVNVQSVLDLSIGPCHSQLLLPPDWIAT